MSLEKKTRTEEVKEQAQVRVMIAAMTAGQRMLAVLFVLGFLGFTVLYGDISISFSSRLDSVNEQSGGNPMDTSFTFQLGTFDGITPDGSNTNLWLSNWVAAPNSNSDPLSGSTVSYTQTPLPSFVAPITGESNQFSGSITLASNASPFGQTDQAYIWGYNDRGTSGTGEWILITNPAWLFPEALPGVIQLGGPEYQVSDAGTIAVLGSVNPGFSTSGDDPHMVTASVPLMPVPEPSVALLFAGGLSLALLRRRC